MFGLKKNIIFVASNFKLLYNYVYYNFLAIDLSKHEFFFFLKYIYILPCQTGCRIARVIIMWPIIIGLMRIPSSFIGFKFGSWNPFNFHLRRKKLRIRISSIRLDEGAWMGNQH